MLKEKIIAIMEVYAVDNSNWEDRADQIIALLKKSLLEKLPKEQTQENVRAESLEWFIRGRNSCLSDITKIIENI